VTKKQAKAEPTKCPVCGCECLPDALGSTWCHECMDAITLLTAHVADNGLGVSDAVELAIRLRLELLARSLRG